MRKIEIESLPNKRSWVDADVLILHSSFQHLKDCVEKEGLFEHSPAYANTKEGLMAKELYDWWMKRKDIQDYSDKQYTEDNQQLIKLINIRYTLWT
jgi:hypothetical protein